MLFCLRRPSLYIYIYKNIMNKWTLLALVATSFTAQAQQLPNANFNGKWVDCIPFIGSNETGKVQGTQPEGWVISNVNGYQGLGATIVGSQLTENENLAVALKNTPNPFMASQIVPAYMSLGTTWNTSKGMLSITNKDGGSFGGMKFTHRPDAIQFKYKRTAAEPSVPATVVAYMWKGEWQQADVPVSIALSGEPTKETMINRDRSILGIESAEGGAVTKSEDALCIAQIQEKLSEITEEWKEMTIPFNYADKNAVPTHINVIFAANDYFDASTVKKDNTLSIDDVAFVYYHALESLTYGDKVYTPNAEGVIDLSEVTFDANTPMQFHVKGVGATVEKGTLNADTQEMTLEVRGNDFAANPESKTTYTLRFKAEAPAPALELTSLTISGMPFEALEAGKTAYTLPYVYNPGIVFKGTTNEGYTVGESVFDNKAKTHTVNVVDPAKNDTTSYVFSFTDAVEDAATGNYEGSLSVVLTAQDDNSVPTALSNANIRITKNANGTINLAIDDFAFGGMVVGDIFVSNVPMKDGKIEKTRRTILMTDFDEAGNKLDYSMGWMMGALPVEVSADLNTTDKRTSASIDIITAENPMLAMMFKGIHVDFVPFTVSGEMKENGFGGRQYYENLKVKGAVTKENCKFLQINNHYVDAASNNEEHNLPMSFLDLSEATVAADVTMSDIMAGAPKANNTLVYLPEGNTIEAANAIVGTNAKELALNDTLTFVSPKAFTAEAVNYSREFEADSYATLFLPFGTEKFDGEAYKFVKADSEKLYFETAKQLEALTPYLVKPLSAKPFANAAAEVAVAANDTVVKVTNNGMTFAGVLTAADSLNAEGEKVFALNADHAFAPVNDKACAAFRAIMFGNSKAEVLTLVIDNKVTGIVDASLDFNKLVDVYNIEGKLIRSRVAAASALNGLGSGIYIINGKKVIK
jgi:hypothetical protein